MRPARSLSFRTTDHLPVAGAEHMAGPRHEDDTAGTAEAAGSQGDFTTRNTYRAAQWVGRGLSPTRPIRADRLPSTARSSRPAPSPAASFALQQNPDTQPPPTELRQSLGRDRLTVGRTRNRTAQSVSQSVKGDRRRSPQTPFTATIRVSSSPGGAATPSARTTKSIPSGVLVMVCPSSTSVPDTAACTRLSCCRRSPQGRPVHGPARSTRPRPAKAPKRPRSPGAGAAPGCRRQRRPVHRSRPDPGQSSPVKRAQQASAYP